MKAFFAGLLFLIFACLIAAVGSIAWVLLFPILIVMGFLLRLAFLFILVIFSIWLLGKILLYAWKSLKKIKI